MSTTMATVRFPLPAAEDDLWHQVVVRLLEQRYADEGQARDHLRLLEELAFHHRFCGKPLTHAFVEDTATWLAKERDFGSPRDKAQGWLADLERWELLVRRGSDRDAIYEVAIGMLDEYFAARHLAARWTEGDPRYHRWLIPSEEWWRQDEGMRCPNPHCLTTLERFWIVRFDQQHVDTVLLMVGLLRTKEREEQFLRSMMYDSDLNRQALKRCRHAHPEVVREQMNHILHSVDWDWVEAAIADFSRPRAPKNGDAILDSCVAVLFAGLDSGLRQAAAVALGCSQDHRAVKLLREALKDEDEDVRWAAAYALGKTGTPEAVEFLIDSMLNDTYFEVTWTAAEALGQLGDVRAIPALETLSNSADEATRYWALRALEEIGHRDRFTGRASHHMT